MANTVIKVRNLGKLYHVGMAQDGRSQYKSFRDELSKAFLSPLKKGLQLLHGNATAASGLNETLWALKDVSFEIKQGEVVGVIGRNGAGKSTLLKILSRITTPTEGCAEIYGRIGSLLEVGTGFHPELTGRENVFLNGAILGMRKTEIKLKFDEIIAFAEIEKFLDTPVKHYSSGMYMRMAFAVAAHLEPEVLLIDEILAVGDVAFQKKCLNKMEEVSKQGRTVLYVSHNMYSLQNLCQRGILLGGGQLLKDGSIGEVVDEYLNEGWNKDGEVLWTTPSQAPGNKKVRLKAVRVVSDGLTTGYADISKDSSVEVDYWNLEENARRLVSIHLFNSKGICIFTSANTPGACFEPDPWFYKKYPVGLFRTSCLIPSCFMNDGIHSVHVFINERGAGDNILHIKDVLVFMAQDSNVMRDVYSGPWLGAIRPRLAWKTVQLENKVSELVSS